MVLNVQYLRFLMYKKILILNLFLAATENMIDPTLLLGNISLAIYILDSDFVW